MNSNNGPPSRGGSAPRGSNRGGVSDGKNTDL